MARKRQQAREAGLCYVCRKSKLDSGNTVCPPCRALRAKFKRRSYARKRERSAWEQIIEGHERAGDMALRNRLYEDAEQHFQQALNVRMIAAPDRLRILEKLISVLLLGANPLKAEQPLEQLSLAHAQFPSDPFRMNRMLSWRGQVLSFNCKTMEALRVSKQAIRIADTSDSLALQKRARLDAAAYLVPLYRFKEIQLLLDWCGNIDEDEAPLRVGYYRIKAHLAATVGNVADAESYFNRAFDSVREDVPYHGVPLLVDRALCAEMLGDVPAAKSYHERAIFLCRRFHSTSFTPWMLIAYAGLLFRMGSYHKAHESLLDALSYNVKAPVISQELAEYGLPIAMHEGDKILLAQCVDSQALELAFQSKASDRIGPTAAAFAQWYVASGCERDARVVLHRALVEVDYLNQIWGLPIAVARYGDDSDFPKARDLIARKAVLPSSDVARACLALYDAFVAQRHSEAAEVVRYASDAVHRFRLLGLHGYADLAQTLCPSPVVGAAERTDEMPFADATYGLSIRERQVAELVLKGLMNREIAERLNVREHTIEKHMSAIMKALGIRSRYQIAGIATKDFLT